MNNKMRKIHSRKSIALASSLIALTSALGSYQANAQDDSDMLEEVVVSGTRVNLQNAQDIKREADTFVDAISAEDIGSLPDRSVLEAIQRLPGVAVERFAGPDDPDHFSVEGSGAIIRGMTQTRSEFNGRDSFTANSGRGLSFQDVPPELMGKVEVFKNQTADMIEGGIGGTITLHTRKPFDSDNRQAAFTIDYSYGDLAEEWSPTFSGLFSDRWDTDLGEFGLLLNIADSTLVGESHGIQSDAYVEYWARNIPGAESFEGVDNNGTVWLPNAANALMKTDDRERQGFATSLQWANPNDTVEVTLDYIRSEAQLSWHEQALKYQGGFQDIDRRESTALDTGNPETDVLAFDENGLFESGTLVWGGPTHNGWRVSGGNVDHASRTWGTNSRPQFGHKFQTDSRVQDTRNLIEDMSLNIKWHASDNLELEADLQYIDAETSVDDLVIHLGSFASQNYDTSGKTPTLTLIEPWHGYRDANPDLFTTYPGDVPVDGDGNPYFEAIYPGFSNDPAGDTNYYNDPNSYFWRSAMDKYERSEGESTAATIDGTYQFEGDNFFKSVKAGIRYAKREQLIRDTGWDWSAVAPEWSSARAGWLMDEDYAAQSGDWEYVDWSDFHGGGVVNIPEGKTIHATEDFVRAVLAPNNTRDLITSAGGSWEGYSSNDVYDVFDESQIFETTETNKALYIRLDFGGDGELRYSGNIGLRYVELSRESNGFIRFPDLVAVDAPPAELGSSITAQSVIEYATAELGQSPTGAEMEVWLAGNPWASEDINYLSNAEQGFGDYSAEAQSAKADFKMFLPSFNFKLELTDDLIARFALAEAVALPDIGDVQNRVVFGSESVQTIRPTPVDEENPTAEEQLIETAYVSSWNGSGDNPYMEPMGSVQYDLALEWYFSDVGQLSGTIFHKNLSNYFIKGGNFQPVTNNSSGVTQQVDMYGTVNGGKAKMDGFELAYQQAFEGVLNGFGIQATYTYIDASGVPNNEESYDQAGWVGADANDTGIRVSLDSVPLQGQSKETVNLVGFYDKDRWNARLAYHWRSKYLLTTRDVISKAPLFYDNHGQLDGSLFFDVTNNIELGVQGTNLTNSQSETIMLLNNEGLETGRSWFVADRRVAFVVKGKF